MHALGVALQGRVMCVLDVEVEVSDDELAVFA